MERSMRMLQPWQRNRGIVEGQRRFSNAAEWFAMRLASALEVTQHRAEVHASPLVAGNRQDHNREIQQQECCNELDFIFHWFTMMGHSLLRV